MGSMVSGLADAVLGVAEGVGLSSDTLARYGKCCEAVRPRDHAHLRERRHRDEAPRSRKGKQRIGPKPPPAPLWHNREDIIQRLCGLK